MGYCANCGNGQASGTGGENADVLADYQSSGIGYSSLESALEGTAAAKDGENAAYSLSKKDLVQLYATVAKAYGNAYSQMIQHLAANGYSQKNENPEASDSYSGDRSSIDSLVKGGAIIDKEGKVIMGEQSKIGEAQQVKSMYQQFLDSNLGQKLVEYMTGNGYSKPDIDGYGFLKLGKNVAAAILKTNHPQYRTILAVNKDEYGSLDGVLQNNVLAHETLHAGDPESTSNADKVYLERKTDGNLKKFYTKMAQKATGGLKSLYQSLANLAKQREANPQVA